MNSNDYALFQQISAHLSEIRDELFTLRMMFKDGSAHVRAHHPICIGPPELLDLKIADCEVIGRFVSSAIEQGTLIVPSKVAAAANAASGKPGGGS